MKPDTAKATLNEVQGKALPVQGKALDVASEEFMHASQLLSVVEYLMPQIRDTESLDLLVFKLGELHDHCQELLEEFTP